MSLSYRNRLILAKTETTVGTAIALAKADAVLCGEVKVTPLAAEEAERPVVKAGFGARPKLLGNKHARIQFTVELAGSGAKATPPAWGRMLTACYMTEKVIDNASVAYTPKVPASPKSLTISCNIDGVKQTLAGCRGTFSLSLSAGQVPTLQFDFVGKYADPVDAAQTADPSYSAWKDPVLADPAGTPTAQIFDVDVGLRELSIDYGAEVAWENLIGGTPGARLRDRQTRGNLSVSAPKVATLALVKKAADGDTGALKIAHGGGVAGAIFELSAPKLELAAPSYQDADGIWVMQSAFQLLPNAGGDDFKITTK